MELAEEFLEDRTYPYYWTNANAPKLFYLWGHSYEFNDSNNWEIIEEFCKKVGNREDVWYATNIEIYDYVKAYENLKFSANGKSVYNPSAVDVCINYMGRGEVLVKAGETAKLPE